MIKASEKFTGLISDERIKITFCDLVFSINLSRKLCGISTAVGIAHWGLVC